MTKLGIFKPKNEILVSEDHPPETLTVVRLSISKATMH